MQTYCTNGEGAVPSLRGPNRQSAKKIYEIGYMNSHQRCVYSMEIRCNSFVVAIGYQRSFRYRQSHQTARYNEDLRLSLMGDTMDLQLFYRTYDATAFRQCCYRVYRPLGRRVSGLFIVVNPVRLLYRFVVRIVEYVETDSRRLCQRHQFHSLQQRSSS